MKIRWLVVAVVSLLIGSGLDMWYCLHYVSRQNGEQTCTQEAKLCPDGSAVGRSGPQCAFVECPGEKSAAKEKK
jgi:hypothetical protein